MSLFSTCIPGLRVLATGLTTVTVGGDFGITSADVLPVFPVFDNGTRTEVGVCLPVSVLVLLGLVEIMFPVITELPMTDGFADPLFVTTTVPPLLNAFTDIKLLPLLAELALTVLSEEWLMDIFAAAALATLCPLLTETILALPLTALVPLPLLIIPFLIKSFCGSIIVCVPSLAGVAKVSLLSDLITTIVLAPCG